MNATHRLNMSDSINQIPHAVKLGLDAAAVSVAGASFFTEFTHFLSQALVILTFIWVSMNIYTWIVNKKWKKQ